jgi:hypothetical protein
MRRALERTARVEGDDGVGEYGVGVICWLLRLCCGRLVVMKRKG